MVTEEAASSTSPSPTKTEDEQAPSHPSGMALRGGMTIAIDDQV
jgi:hypothetical protein